jgi:hypothetical protein
MHRKEEIEVVQISLAHAEKSPVSHETSEFQRRIEIEVFSENKVVWNFFGQYEILPFAKLGDPLI